MKQLILIFSLLIPVLTFAGNSEETNKYKDEIKKMQKDREGVIAAIIK